MLSRIAHPLGDVLSVDGDPAVLLSYFRNNVLHLFTASAWIACCFLPHRRMSRPAVLLPGRPCYPVLPRALVRPPAYFVAGLWWVAPFPARLAAPFGSPATLRPRGILSLLRRVTGIPMAEEQSLRSKGDAFRRYQAETSAFIPLPPRRAATPR